ncbi:DUF4226 domain-containing protein [Nocardia speluncae]|uniref:DUF4226 domain-containing protein n=1 Tax=Nocardia speluncae TaxID=419477 RepID=A0A846XFD6_9NOCA|nr:NlpC/P60 family protein [Nocardia speluncae]NKY34788.1 DUF4226 domain-containing protein [Nocardia speluncae]
MTSAEIGPFAVEAEFDDNPDDDGATGTGSPWTGERRRWGAGGGNANAPGAPAAPPGPATTAGPTATPVAHSAPAPAPIAAPPPGLALPGLPTLPLPGLPAPAEVQQSAPPAAGHAPAAAPVADRREDADPEPLVDPEMLARMAPMAMMAGTALLPMIGSALSGLTGGGGAAPAAEAGASGMSPEAERAMKVLKLLEDMYGEGEPKDPEAKKLKEDLGGSESARGEGPAMLKARMLFQDNAAKAFNNLDKQLLEYISGLAGSNKVDKGAVRSLLNQVNAALAELGPMAYTKEGQQKVRQILTVALKAAHKIVAGGSANAGDAASAIKQLTNQYLYNLMGKDLPGGVKFASGKDKAGNAGSKGGSARAQHAVKTALNQVGDPYVWGAEGPDSFDCSGLMQYAAKKAGVNIPRVADDQMNSLPKVANKDIQPGDLIFPESSYKNGEMGHVMMYIGDGKCVEAPSRGKDVRVTSLPSSFAARRWAD